SIQVNIAPNAGLAEASTENNSAASTILVNGNILVFGDDYVQDAADILTGLGYSVETQVTLPTDLTPYRVIWHVSAFSPLTSAEMSRLADFLAKGGGLHLTGERPCCDDQNNSVTTFVNSVVVAGGVTVGNQGDIGDPYPFNSAAIGGVTTTPNTLTTWT